MKITKRKAKGVLADMIANMNEDSLARTREQMEGITEDYCSQEVVKLLKEKGFKIPQYYNSLIGIWQDVRVTHQMAMKWLREVHRKYIDIRYNSQNEKYRFIVFTMVKDKPIDFIHSEFHSTYEETTEAALFYVLENLI